MLVFISYKVTLSYFLFRSGIFTELILCMVISLFFAFLTSYFVDAAVGLQAILERNLHLYLPGPLAFL